MTDGLDPNDPEASRPQQPPDHRMPGWVKGFVVAGIVLVVVVAVAVLVFGGHGPSRHLPGGNGGEVGSPVDHTPPVDHG